jgi:hypothetical protein
VQRQNPCNERKEAAVDVQCVGVAMWKTPEALVHLLTVQIYSRMFQYTEIFDNVCVGVELTKPLIW